MLIEASFIAIVAVVAVVFGAMPTTTLSAMPVSGEKLLLANHAVVDLIIDVPVEGLRELHLLMVLSCSLLTAIGCLCYHSLCLEVLLFQMVCEGDHSNFVEKLESG